MKTKHETAGGGAGNQGMGSQDRWKFNNRSTFDFYNLCIRELGNERTTVREIYGSGSMSGKQRAHTMLSTPQNVHTRQTTPDVAIHKHSCTTIGDY